MYASGVVAEQEVVGTELGKVRILDESKGTTATTRHLGRRLRRHRPAGRAWSQNAPHASMSRSVASWWASALGWASSRLAHSLR